ncbi:hypothetical protein BGW80DRAFT_1290257 [Lactifluus volemus]|nr:hypothetical protein BGW80DRAFT_1290257 [Lactifluus volemus]
MVFPTWRHQDRGPLSKISEYDASRASRTRRCVSYRTPQLWYHNLNLPLETKMYGHGEEMPPPARRSDVRWWHRENALGGGLCRIGLGCIPCLAGCMIRLKPNRKQKYYKGVSITPTNSYHLMICALSTVTYLTSMIDDIFSQQALQQANPPWNMILISASVQ